MVSLPAYAKASAGRFFGLVRRSLGVGGSNHADPRHAPLYAIRILSLVPAQAASSEIMIETPRRQEVLARICARFILSALASWRFSSACSNAAALPLVGTSETASTTTL